MTNSEEERMRQFSDELNRDFQEIDHPEQHEHNHFLLTDVAAYVCDCGQVLIGDKEYVETFVLAETVRVLNRLKMSMLAHPQCTANSEFMDMVVAAENHIDKIKHLIH